MRVDGCREAPRGRAGGLCYNGRMPMSALAAILITLWTAWSVQAILSALMARKFKRRLEYPLREAFQTYNPPAAVIVPFKGVEPGLHEHLDALCSQDYPDYRLVFVVESGDDPAVPALREAMSRHPGRRVELVEAGHAPDHQGQKTHNQISAIEHLRREPEADHPRVWAFADSDAACEPNWLKHLVTLLAYPHYGVTTGYRWLIPSDRNTFWSRLASLMNSAAALFLGERTFNRAWGGAMAVRADDAVRGDLVGYLRGALTDDYQFTRFAMDQRLQVGYAVHCMAPTVVDFDFADFVNFTYRQYLIARVYDTGTFALATALPWLVLTSAATATGTLALCVHTLVGVASGRGWGEAGGLGGAVPWWLAGLALVAVVVTFVAGGYRAGYRRRALAMVLDATSFARLDRSGVFTLDRWGTLLNHLAQAVMMTLAWCSNSMTWRGKRYRLSERQRVERLA